MCDPDQNLFSVTFPLQNKFRNVYIILLAFRQSADLTHFLSDLTVTFLLHNKFRNVYIIPSCTLSS